MIRILTLILLAPLFLTGQTIQSGLWDREPNALRQVNAHYSYALGSASIPFAAQRKIFFDDYLDDAEKELFLSKSQKNNRSALNDLFEFNYTYRLDDAKAQRRAFGLHYNSLRAVNYSENLLKLALYGNAPYAGETLDLTPTAWWRIRYVELFYTWGFDQDRFSYNLTAEVLIGLNEQKFSADRLNWFTPESGEFITLDTKATGFLTDTSSSANSINGLGLGAGISAEYRGDTWTFRGALEDFGFINWNNNSYNFDVDTTYAYEGLYVENLFDIQDNFFDNAIDSLGQEYFPGTQESRLGITPFLLRGEAERSLNDQSQIRLGVQYRYRIFNLPLIYGAYDYKIGEHHEISPSVHYGGYNRLGISVDYRLLFNSWTLHLQAGNLNSWVAPEVSYGINLGLGIRKTW